MDGYAVKDVINGGSRFLSMGLQLPLANNGVIFHAVDLCKLRKNSDIDHTGDDPLAHAQHPIDLLDAEPMKDIGHQGLKAHVLDASHVFGSLEIIRSPVFSTFSCIVDDCGECVSISHGKGNV